MLTEIRGLDAAGFEALVQAGVVNLRPTSLRGAGSPVREAQEPAAARV